jgi:hypothetical protein
LSVEPGEIGAVPLPVRIVVPVLPPPVGPLPPEIGLVELVDDGFEVGLGFGFEGFGFGLVGLGF